MISSSSSGRPYFFFKIFSHSDKFKAEVIGLLVSSSSPLLLSSFEVSPPTYLASFSNSNYKYDLNLDRKITDNNNGYNSVLNIFDKWKV